MCRRSSFVEVFLYSVGVIKSILMSSSEIFEGLRRIDSAEKIEKLILLLNCKSKVDL